MKNPQDRKLDDADLDDIFADYGEDADGFTYDELEALNDLLGDFPELDGLDDILELDDSDFYEGGV